MAGVSPFYSPLSIPALDLLSMPEKQRFCLLRAFSNWNPGSSRILSPADLHEKQAQLIQGKHSLPYVLVASIALFFGASVFAYLALSGSNPRELAFRWWTWVPAGIFALLTVDMLLLHMGILEDKFIIVPFSANFMMEHIIEVIFLFVLLSFGSLSSSIGMKHLSQGTWDLVLLFLFTFLLSAIFLSQSPYDALAWVVWTFPLVGWGVTRRASWLALFASLWIGLGIRRLTQVGVYTSFSLPDRWVLSLGLVCVTLVWVCWQNRKRTEKWRELFTNAVFFTPAVAVIALVQSPTMRAFLLVVCLALLSLSGRERKGDHSVRLAVWTGFSASVLLAVWILPHTSSSSLYSCLPGRLCESPLQYYEG